MRKNGFSAIYVGIGLVFLFILVVAFIKLFPTKGPEPENIGSLPKNERSQSQDQLEAKFVALGSSLTRASNLSTQMQGENNDYSFSGGTKINSVYTYLNTKNNSLTFTMLASPGANMQDILERQLPDALKLNPKYITIDPGADIVSLNSISDYKRHLNQILDQISPQTIVMMFTYPNFTSMRSTDKPACKENKIGVKLENLNEKNVLAFNKAIKETIEERSNVILLDIYELLGPNDISDYDCLHINLEAQKRIAAEFIKAITNRE